MPKRNEMAPWEKQQRNWPIPEIGMVIGTHGTAPYVHLQLHFIRKFFGDEMDVLVINDGTEGPCVKEIEDLCRQYLVEFIAQEHLGHVRGDFKIFERGMKWAIGRGVDVLAKFSRRSIPLIPWRYDLLCLAGKYNNASAFGRYENDNDGSLLRTDAIALRLELFNHDRFWEAIDKCTKLPEGELMQVEDFFKSWVKSQGGMVRWGLLETDFYRPNAQMTQWRGMLPTHFAEIARAEGLPYTVEDFRTDKPKIEKSIIEPANVKEMVVVESDGFVESGPLAGVPKKELGGAVYQLEQGDQANG